MREFSVGPILSPDCELVVESMVITTMGVLLNQIADQEIGPLEHRAAGFRFEPSPVTILSSA